MTYQDPRYRDPEYAGKWRAENPDKVRAQSSRTLERHREANRERASKHYYANREDRKAKSRAYYSTHREQQRLTRIVREFGLSQSEYAALVEAQDGRCAICGSGGRLAIDHDHASGVVRGLLCATCNFMVGHGKDDPALLRRAAGYLEERS